MGKTKKTPPEGPSTVPEKKIIVSASSGIYHSVNIHEMLAVAQVKAQEIIDIARAKKNQRIKEAKVEAQKYLEAFRAAKEKEFEELKNRFAAEQAALQETVKAECVKKIAEIHASSKKNRRELVKKLTEYVLDIRPRVPTNYVVRRYLEEGVLPPQEEEETVKKVTDLTASKSRLMNFLGY